MPRSSFPGIFLRFGLLAAASLPTVALARSGGPPSVDLPNPFAPAACFGQLASGRAWGGTTAVAVGADGNPVSAEKVTADANGTVYDASNEGKRIVRFSKQS